MNNVSQAVAVGQVGETGVADPQDKEPPPFKTLRLTLAMRGGVSLAVWIGGVVAELDLFRRACTVSAGNTWDINNGAAFLVTGATDTGDRIERAKQYRELLEKANYRGVEIDILAGASAGGLNAVLYGLSQASRSVLDETVRQTWINEGGIWELLHPGVAKKSDTQSWRDWSKSLVNRRLKSILQGDTRLYGVAYKALQKLNVDSDAGTPQQYGAPAGRPYNLSIELAATLLDDVHSPGRGNRAGFSFRRTAGDLASGYSTIPSSTDPSDTALRRLALAARSTSSFPGAFEPAELRSTTPEFDATGLLTNMAPVFPHARQQSEQSNEEGGAANPFIVVDGGIFDNIPIDRAIRAIRRAPSALPTERRLVYIDPEPPSAQTPVGFNSADTDEVTAWLPVILASSALQKRSETAADELGQLRAHNDNVRRTQGRLEALASRLGAAGAATPVGSAAYAQYRIGSDATRIGELLTDPWSYVCQPPRYAGDYHALPAEQAVYIGNEVREAYNALPDEWPLAHDVYAVLDQIRLLISWVRELERLLPHYSTKAPTPIDTANLTSGLEIWKCRLYRYLLAATEARQQTVDLVLTESLRGPLPPANSLAYAAKDPTGAWPDSGTLAGAILSSQVQQHALTIPESVVGELQIEALPATDGALYSALAAWMAENAGNAAVALGQEIPVPLCEVEVGTAAQVEPGGEQGFCVLMEADLDAIKSAIRDGSGGLALAMIDIESPFDWVRRWKESVFPHLYASLADLDIVALATIFAETGTPDTAALVMYEEITSDLEPNPPAGRLVLEPIKRAARAKHLQRWLRREPNQEQVDAVIRDPRSVMNADAKLAGNGLSRFGGFFLARWRENDWQWGRLDAAAGIVRILQPSAESGPTVRRLQRSILKGANSTLEPEDRFLPLRVGAETLDSINPHYRFALASRAVPLVLRALLPTARLSPISVMQRAVLLLVRLTLGVIAPLVADPLRLAVAVTVIISAAGLLGGGDTSKWWLVVPAGLAIAILIRTGRAEMRWGLLRERVGGCEGGATAPDRASWCDVYEKAHQGIRGSRWCRTYSWVLGALAAAVAIAGWFSMPSLATLLLLVAAIAGLHMWCMGRTYRIRGTQAVDRTFGEAIRNGVDNLRSALKAGASSPERSRALRPLMSVGVLTTALLCSYVAHLIATGRPDVIFGFPEPGALTGGLPSAGVVATASGILAFNSLWGWARNRVAMAVTALAAGVGWCAQWGLDHRLVANGHATYDLLPVVIWLVVVGVLVQYIPCRPLDEGGAERNTRYGEKNRPVITPSP